MFIKLCVGSEIYRRIIVINYGLTTASSFQEEVVIIHNFILYEDI
jgi:hypothetical protein